MKQDTLVHKLALKVGIERTHQRLVFWGDENKPELESLIGEEISEDEMDELFEQFAIFYGIYFALVQSSDDPSDEWTGTALAFYDHYLVHERETRA